MGEAGWEGGRDGGGLYSIFMPGRGRMTIAIRPSHLYNSGTVNVVFSPTTQRGRGRGGGVLICCLP